MFYELRRYQTQPGRRYDWVRYMEDVVIPYMTAQGMTVTASFIDEEDEDAYVWIRRFDDEQQRADLYAAVYESDHWKTEIAPGIGPLLIPENSVITRLTPTPQSGLR